MKNRVNLIGNVGKIEKLDLVSGKTVVNMTLATQENYKNKDGIWVENSVWHELKAWDKTAELLNENISVGDLVVIEGKLSYNINEKDGKKYKNVFVLVNSFLRLKEANKEK